MTEVNRLVEHLFRHESGKMLYVITRLFGFPNYDIARDVVQDTLLAAMQHWKLNGIPDNPTGWLYATAKKHYETAIQLTTSKVEWQLSWKKIESIS